MAILIGSDSVTEPCTYSIKMPNKDMFADDVIKLIEYFKNEFYEDYFYIGKRIDDLTREIEDLRTSIRELKYDSSSTLNDDDSKYDISNDFPF